MSKEYWSIAVDSISDATGVLFDRAQTDKAVQILERFHDDYGNQHGYREGDKSVARMKTAEDQKVVLRFVEEQMRLLDCGSSVFFNYLNSTQKAALARLQFIQNELQKH